MRNSKSRISCLHIMFYHFRISNMHRRISNIRKSLAISSHRIHRILTHNPLIHGEGISIERHIHHHTVIHISSISIYHSFHRRIIGIHNMYLMNASPTGYFVVTTVQRNPIRQIIRRTGLFQDKTIAMWFIRIFYFPTCRKCHTLEQRTVIILSGWIAVLGSNLIIQRIIIKDTHARNNTLITFTPPPESPMVNVRC